MYWDRLVLGMNSGAQTVLEASSLAEVVVVGRWVAVEPDKGYGAPGESLVGWYATALIEVDQVLKGPADIQVGAHVRVPFELGMSLAGGTYPESQVAEADKTRPPGSALLFLESYSTFWDRTNTDVPDWIRDLDKPDLYRLIGADGAVPLVGEAVSDVVYETEMPPWRLEAAGQDLSTLSADIVVAAPSTSP